ncbi:MAG: sensor histidine kinase [Myxococcota bacterium]
MKPPSEQERLEQRFVTRARALTLVRAALLTGTQIYFPNAVFAALILAGIALSHQFAPNKKWGPILVFSTLSCDLIWLINVISHTGNFASPLIAILPAVTLLFAMIFHQPLTMLPPLLILPILTALHPDVSLQALALYSLLNGCTIYLTNKILGEEEATSRHIMHLEQALKKQAIIEERQRLSRDIHDGVGSVLSALILQAEQAGSIEIQDLAREALQETRYAISIMRDDLDLNLQIKNCLDLFAKRNHINSRLNIPGNLSSISHTRALSILRILQESLTNIAKHAQAHNVEVNASFEQNQLLLDIKDDGIGFDPTKIPKNHYGIRNIEERVQQMGGTFKIQSQPLCGTHIQIGASL